MVVYEKNLFSSLALDRKFILNILSRRKLFWSYFGQNFFSQLKKIGQNWVLFLQSVQPCTECKISTSCTCWVKDWREKDLEGADKGRRDVLVINYMLIPTAYGASVCACVNLCVCGPGIWGDEMGREVDGSCKGDGEIRFRDVYVNCCDKLCVCVGMRATNQTWERKFKLNWGSSRMCVCLCMCVSDEKWFVVLHPV